MLSQSTDAHFYRTLAHFCLASAIRFPEQQGRQGFRGVGQGGLGNTEAARGHTFSRGRGLLCVGAAVLGHQVPPGLVQQAAQQLLLPQGAPLQPAGLQQLLTQETQLSPRRLCRAAQRPQGPVDGIDCAWGRGGRAPQCSQCLSNEVHQGFLQRPALEARTINLPKQELQQGLCDLGGLPQEIPEHRDSFWAEPRGPALLPQVSIKHRVHSVVC